MGSGCMKMASRTGKEISGSNGLIFIHCDSVIIIDVFLFKKVDLIQIYASRW
jgi:hypothetical protein